MENENKTWGKDVQQPRYEETPQKPASPFADSPYEITDVQREKQTVQPARRNPQKNGKRLLCIALVLALLAVGCGVTAVCVSAYWNNKMQVMNQAVDNKLAVLQEKIDSAQNIVSSSGNASSQDGALTPGQVYAQNVQAVVAISNQSLTTNIYGQVSETASSGSGFIISEDGYVVSNYHVVQGATTLSVITSDSQEYDAELVGYDSTNDLAVLKIEADGLPYVKLGSSDALAVGDQVLAIGNPLGELTSTLTVGYISAKDRMVNTDGSYMNMLQTDAAINSGNSGGPLFNMNGEVVGITTAKYSGTSTSGATIEGIGFAIPMDDILGMIEDLVEHGYVTGAYLGVMVRDMDAAVAQMYGLPTGVYVDEVTAGSCAQAAGVRSKDIIVNIGGYDVTNMSELSRVLRRFEAGQTTTITVYRGGAQVHMNITFDAKPLNTATQEPTVEETVPSYGSIEDWFGGMFPGFGG